MCKNQFLLEKLVYVAPKIILFRCSKKMNGPGNNAGDNNNMGS